MDTKSKKEIVAKAWDKVAPIAEKEKNATKAVIENIAVLTTMITIGAYVVMYAYKAGYYIEYNIPSACIRVSLKDYLPLLFQICSSSVYILWYIVASKSDQALNRIRINGYRILYGHFLIYMILSSNGIIKFFPYWLFLLITVGLSVIIELLLFFVRKARIRNKSKDRNVSIAEQGFILENTISDIFFYRYYIRTGFFILAIAVVIAPFWGRLLAKANDSFQVFQMNNDSHVVIADYEDSIMAQKALINDTNIVIDTSSYYFYPKEGIEFKNCSFKSVNRQQGQTSNVPEDSEGSLTTTKTE